MGYTIFGGQLRPGINLSIAGQLPVPAETVRRNIRHSAGLGLKTYRQVPPAGRHLAVIGGGTSIKAHVEEIRAFNGDVWAINGAWGWCRDNGIDATFLAVDPDPIVMKWAKGVTRALLEMGCDPGVFEMLKGADVTVFDCNWEAGGIVARGSTATAVPHLSCRMGYRGVTFYGCESCYPPAQSHAYVHEHRDDELLVECDGDAYLTAPDFYIQAIELSNFIRELPEYLSERSGGLLRAMVKNPDFHIRWVSDALAKGISEIPKVQAA